MTVEIIPRSISTIVWDWAGIELATPGSAVRLASVARHVKEFCVCSLFCYTVLSINSSFALIPLGKRELFALFLLSSCCHATVSVLGLFLTVWLVGLQYVIVVFSGLLVLRIAQSIKIVVFSGLLV